MTTLARGSEQVDGQTAPFTIAGWIAIRGDD
jgi:hypothetical protein